MRVRSWNCLSLLNIALTTWSLSLFIFDQMLSYCIVWHSHCSYDYTTSIHVHGVFWCAVYVWTYWSEMTCNGRRVTLLFKSYYSNTALYLNSAGVWHITLVNTIHNSQLISWGCILIHVLYITTKCLCLSRNAHSSLVVLRRKIWVGWYVCIDTIHVA